VVAATFYTLLRRFTAHGSDVFFLMQWMVEDVVHPNHPLYLEGARAVRWLLSSFTDDRMTALAAFSAGGGAIAVGALHRAALRLRSPEFAFWLAAVVLCTPCLMFFATIGEMAAPFCGAAALCWWAWVSWCERGRLGCALLTGILTGLATTLHATGQLLVPMLGVGYLWMRRSEPLARRGGSVSVFVVAHAIVFACCFTWLRSLGEVPPGEPAGFLWQRASSGLWLEYLPSATLSQWVVAFAPLSLLALLAFVRGRAAVAIGLHAAVLGYVAITAMLAPGADEVGAYCLPLLFPVAVVVLDAVPSRSWWLLVVFCAAATGVHRSMHREIAPDFALGTAITDSKGGSARVWLVGDEGESWGARWRNHDVELVETWIALVDLEQRSGSNIASLGEEELLVWLQVTAQRVFDAGNQLMVTEHAITVLSARLQAFAAAWQRFKNAYLVEPIEAADGWRGYLVQRR
jgi:hypothetical protein